MSLDINKPNRNKFGEHQNFMLGWNFGWQDVFGFYSLPADRPRWIFAKFMVLRPSAWLKHTVTWSHLSELVSCWARKGMNRKQSLKTSRQWWQATTQPPSAALLHGLCADYPATRPDQERLKSIVLPSRVFCVAFLEWVRLYSVLVWVLSTPVLHCRGQMCFEVPVVFQDHCWHFHTICSPFWYNIRLLEELTWQPQVIGIIINSLVRL